MKWRRYYMCDSPSGGYALYLLSWFGIKLPDGGAAVWPALHVLFLANNRDNHCWWLIL